MTERPGDVPLRPDAHAEGGASEPAEGVAPPPEPAPAEAAAPPVEATHAADPLATLSPSLSEEQFSVTEFPSEIAHPEQSARIPGDTRRPLTRFPTDSLGIVPSYETGAGVDTDELLVHWEPAQTPAFAKTRFSGWALAAAILALTVSFFVGWAIPISLLAVGTAIAALRRPTESRSIAIWALVLGLLSTVFSLGWLIWASMALERLG